ncbi:MAG TPA: hypothetical protein VML96_06380, partial [Egibacteraceae bacterium]|nr:hypothetical protein [Egibacteraceae bacterium]
QLAPADRRACRSDLKRLLDAEGLSRTPILTTSATTGEGVDELRALIAGEVGRRRAIAERLSADVRTLAAEIRSQVGPAARGRGAVADLARSGRQSAPLRSALASAAGVQARADVGAALYRSTAKAATRPLLSRLIWGLVTLALRPFRLLRPTRRPRPAPADEAVAGTTAPAAPIAVRHALLELADAAAHGLPPRWGPRLRQLLAGVGRDLPRRVIDALESVAVQRPRRRWWRPVGLLWSASEAVALAGLIWLAALAALAWLQLPAPDTPNVAGRLPWPTALLAGGATAWLVLGWVRNRLVSLGARRWRRRLAAQLQQALADVVAEHVAAPLAAELDAQSALARAVEQAAGNR